MLGVGVVVRRGRAWQGVGAGTRRWCASLVSQARDKLRSLGEGDVTLDKDGCSGVATITLRNQARKNALSGRMMVQLADITQDLVNWPEGKAVIFEADGDFFCSGGDLTTVRAISNPNDGLLMSTLMHDTLTRLYTLPLLTVCLVHGAAIGGGAELTTSTDFRIFTKTGAVNYVQAKMGVVTGWGGGTRLARLVGHSVALDLLTACRKVAADEAVQIGLAECVVSVEDRRKALEEWLMARISHTPEVVRAIKRIAVAARDLPLNQSLYEERHVFAPLWGGPANVKALGKNLKHK